MITGGNRALPYWRLSGFYFFYFALLGAWMTYWPLYLKKIDFSYQQIGLIAGTMMATKIFAPSVWGWLAAKTQQRTWIIRMGACFALLFFCFVPSIKTFWSMVVIIVLFSFFWNAILAQFEVVTLSHLLGGNEHRYSHIRLWGSIGFIVLVVSLGVFFDYVDLQYLPWVIITILVVLVFNSFITAENPKLINDPKSKPALFTIVKHPVVIAFFCCCFLLQLSHGPYYTFFSVLLEDYHYSRTMIGLLWSLGVFAEVIIFMVMHRLLARFNLRIILLVTLVLSALRWLLIAFFVEHLPVLLFAQCLHAASFGSFHAVAIELIRHYFKRGNEGHGMALYSGITFGAGGAIGSVMSGQLWEVLYLNSFLISAAFCVLASLIASRVYIEDDVNESV